MKKIAIHVLLLLGLLHSASGQDSGSDRFLNWMVLDPGRLVSDIGRTEALTGVGLVFVVAPAAGLDRRINEWGQTTDEGGLKFLYSATNHLGSPIALPLAGAVFGISLLTGGTKFQDAAFTSVQSIIYSGTLVYGLKYAIGRGRPEDGFGPFHFRPFRELNASFPSGHSSTAFALTVPWLVYYPGIPSAILVTAAFGTAMTRIAREKHWFTDVIVGSFVGAAFGVALSRLHQSRQDAYVPNALPRSLGTSIRLIDFRFKL